MGRLLTTEEFIAKAKEIHGEKYDYSETVYRGRRKNMGTIYLLSKNGLIKSRRGESLRLILFSYLTRYPLQLPEVLG